MQSLVTVRISTRLSLVTASSRDYHWGPIKSPFPSHYVRRSSMELVRFGEHHSAKTVGEFCFALWRDSVRPLCLTNAIGLPNRGRASSSATSHIPKTLHTRSLRYIMIVIPYSVMTAIRLVVDPYRPSRSQGWVFVDARVNRHQGAENRNR